MISHFDKKAACCGSVLAMAIACMAPALAQDFERITPKAPVTTSPGTLATPATPATPAVAKKLLLQDLKGLYLVGDAKLVVRTGVKDSGVVVGQGLPQLNNSEIRGKLAAFLGKPLNTDDLPRISQIIIDWYREHQLPVVDVVFPEQDISGGTVQAVVYTYRLGQVKVTGANWFNSEVLRREIRLDKGDLIDFSTLKNDLNLLNRNPFHTVNAVLESGAAPGETDVHLNVNDRFPLRVFAVYDNDGYQVTGRDQYSVGFNWGNVVGLDQQFSYRYITSPDLWRSRNRGAGHSDAPRMQVHSADYWAARPWGDAIDVFGYYAKQVPNLGSYFDQIGQSLQMSVRYEKSLPMIGLLSHQIKFGFDYKRSDNNLAFGGTSIFANATNVQQFSLIYDGTRDDDYGETAIENQFFYSPGGFSDGNRTSVYRASGVNGAKANYVYDNLQITRVTKLPWNMSSLVRLQGQIASTELLPSEQIGAGGSESVRGYDPRAANGSQGFTARVEFRSPPYSPLRKIFGDVEDTGQVLAFYDAGFLSHVYHQTGGPKSATLQSAGVGLNYDVSRYFDLRFSYGWALNKVPGAPYFKNLANISVTTSY